MSIRYNSALRQAIYLVDCPLQTLADNADIAKSTLYTAMQGKKRLLRPTANRLATAVCEQIHIQIATKEREIEHLKHCEQELCLAYGVEYGRDADAGKDDRPRLPR